MSPSRRRTLRLGAVVLGASLSGCVSGILGVEDSGDPDETATETAANSTDERSTDEPTTHAVGVGTSVPDGSVEFPEGPKSRPDRPEDLTADRAREYVETFEHRRMYNRLSRDGAVEVRVECDVDSVAEYADGYRVVVGCSGYADVERNGTTYHADYFVRYATYFVGPETTVRRDGRPAE